MLASGPICGGGPQGSNDAQHHWKARRFDATYLKQREWGRIISVAAIIAVAVNTDGRREIVGLHIGLSEAETFWSAFLKSLVRRGLNGVKLVISDAHEGLKAAIRRSSEGSACEACGKAAEVGDGSRLAKVSRGAVEEVGVT